MRSLIAAAAIVTAGLFAVAAPVAAQTDWPTRNVTVIIPWAAGGGTDPLARLIFDDMATRLGKPFLLDFRPGAAGTIGASAAAKAENDGYTMMFTSGSPLVNANFMKGLTYDPKTDLPAVAQVTYGANVIVANANVPYNNLQELIDYAKANPGKINAAIPGIGSNGHLLAAKVEYQTDIKLNMVPYAGAGPQMTDLMSGAVDIGFGFPAGFISGVKAGKLKYIAILSDKRSKTFPDVTTSDESKVKGVYSGNWFMAFVPKGTPDAIIQKMNAEIRTSIAKPEIQAKIEALGYNVVTGEPKDGDELIRKEVAAMGELINSGKFKLE